MAVYPCRYFPQRSRPYGQADFWALGVTLFEMLTGQRPFTGESQMVLAKAIVSGKPKDIKDLRPDLSEDLAQEVAKCLRIESAAKESVQAPNPSNRSATSTRLTYTLMILIASGLGLAAGRNSSHSEQLGPQKLVVGSDKNTSLEFTKLILENSTLEVNANEFAVSQVSFSQVRLYYSGGERLTVKNGTCRHSSIVVDAKKSVSFVNIVFNECSLALSGGASFTFTRCQFENVEFLPKVNANFTFANCKNSPK